MGELEGRGAVVTGGSRGIGRAIVERLLAEGVSVVFTYARDAGSADEIVAKSDGLARAVQVDLADTARVVDVFDTAAEFLPGLDILVTNAATAEPKPLVEVTEAEYDRIMAVNTKSVFLCLQQAAHRMRDNGRIITISSLNTLMAAPGVGTYAASKAAVEQFTKVAAKELGPRGITVNTISPGATDTDLLRATNSPQGLQMAVAMTPLGRLGRSVDIANAVAMLCGPDAAWITGQNLVAAGGML